MDQIDSVVLPEAAERYNKHHNARERKADAIAAEKKSQEAAARAETERPYRELLESCTRPEVIALIKASGVPPVYLFYEASGGGSMVAVASKGPVYCETRFGPITVASKYGDCILRVRGLHGAEYSDPLNVLDFDQIKERIIGYMVYKKLDPNKLRESFYETINRIIEKTPQSS